MAPFQYQARPSVPLIPSTLPAAPIGVAWNTPFSEPRFDPSSKFWLHQTESRMTGAPPPATGISGTAWRIGWEPPRFRGYPPEQQQTEVYFQNPSTLPALNPGLGWFKPLDQPYFPVLVKYHLQMTQMYGENLSAIVAGAAGIPWMIGWEPPYFKAFSPAQQQTVFFVGTKATLPQVVAGMWLKPFDQPAFPTVTKAYLQQTQFSGVLIPSTLPAAVAGRAWFKPFDPPNQRRTPWYLHLSIGHTHISSIVARPYTQVHIIF